MKHIQILLIILSVIALSGCATAMLAQSNSRYSNDNGIPVIAKSGIIETMVYKYETDNKKIFEIKTSEGVCYLIPDTYKSVLTDNLEGKKIVEVGIGSISLISRNEFDKSDFVLKAFENGRNLIVIGEIVNDEMGVSIDTKVSIFCKEGGSIVTYGTVASELTLKTSSKIAIGVRRMGYLFTVPIDIASAPLFVGIMILAGASHGFNM